MKKVLLAGVAAASLFAASGAASAADLPSRHVQPVAPVVIAPIFTWTGFYVGVNAGYAWNNKSSNNAYVVNGVVFAGGNDGNNGGFTGGGQVGYNYQFGQFVAGLEADINYADLKRSSNYALAFDPALGAFGGSNNGIEWFGTVRARLGVAFDRALVYATGGFAYGGGGNNNGFIYQGMYFENSNNNRTGWTVGGGVEYAITNNITARVEGLYVDLGKSNKHNFVPVFHNNRQSNEFGVVRAGLNYKFDSF
ncbi:outer membrane protein [Pseudochelatococcus sp. G4_1912]|uniref:outer membrane protein n=1 Tax=Pseudochelatococcus sp. G4_1912 TaxID=3114288 RepID=UPI0039C746CA